MIREDLKPLTRLTTQDVTRAVQMGYRVETYIMGITMDRRPAYYVRLLPPKCPILSCMSKEDFEFCKQIEEYQKSMAEYEDTLKSIDKL